MPSRGLLTIRHHARRQHVLLLIVPWSLILILVHAGDALDVEAVEQGGAHGQGRLLLLQLLLAPHLQHLQ